MLADIVSCQFQFYPLEDRLKCKFLLTCLFSTTILFQLWLDWLYALGQSMLINQETTNLTSQLTKAVPLIIGGPPSTQLWKMLRTSSSSKLFLPRRTLKINYTHLPSKFKISNLWYIKVLWVPRSMEENPHREDSDKSESLHIPHYLELKWDKRLRAARCPTLSRLSNNNKLRD